MDAATADLRKSRALLDLADLDRQVAAGELTEDEAQPLRLRYERVAADAMAELTAPVNSEQPPEPERGRSRARVVYGFAAAAAVAAIAVLLLPRFVGGRPPGGFATGNEARGTASATPVPSTAPGRDLSKVSDAEMEAVIAANPDVLEMRLALAQRYTDQGRYDQAVAQYLAVLQRDSGNAEAQAHLGWALLQVGRPQDALPLVDRALRTQPTMLHALWFKANILLYGNSDPGGAIDVLRTMQREPLSPEVSKQVVDLLAVAAAKGRSGG